MDSENRKPSGKKSHAVRKAGTGEPRKQFFAGFQKADYLTLIFIVSGIILRFVLLGVIPGNGGLNQDEAFAGYEAYSLLHYGIDSHGYHFPVYFYSWGSGMNVLESYLMIPGIALFGVTNFAVRLPQAVMGCISVIVFYLLTKELRGKGAACAAAFILAFCPWHVILSRWGLESNIQPAFILLAVYFIVKSVKNTRYFLLAGLFFGLSLYGYAASWAVLPFFAILVLLYLIFGCRVRFDRNILGGIMILAVLAAPLLLFVLVNRDVIKEIRTPFLSVPKLGYYRGGEISFKLRDMIVRLRNSLQMLWNGTDGSLVNSISDGWYFKISPPFFFVGLAGSFRRIRRRFREGDPETFVWIWFVTGLLECAVIDANGNRVNLIFLPIFYFIAVGIHLVMAAFHERKWDAAAGAIAAAYALCAFLFVCNYFTDFNDAWSSEFHNDISDAVVYLKEIISCTEEGETADSSETFSGKVHVMNISYPVFLLEMQYPADVFSKTLIYTDDGVIFGNTESVLYQLGDFSSEEIVKGDIYVCSNSGDGIDDYMETTGLERHDFRYYTVWD